MLIEELDFKKAAAFAKLAADPVFKLAACEFRDGTTEGRALFEMIALWIFSEGSHFALELAHKRARELVQEERDALRDAPAKGSA